jgi:hypothetical protein
MIDRFRLGRASGLLTPQSTRYCRNPDVWSLEHDLRRSLEHQRQFLTAMWKHLCRIGATDGSRTTSVATSTVVVRYKKSISDAQVLIRYLPCSESRLFELYVADGFDCMKRLYANHTPDVGWIRLRSFSSLDIPLDTMRTRQRAIRGFLVFFFFVFDFVFAFAWYST